METIALHANSEYTVKIIEAMNEAGWKLKDVSNVPNSCFIHLEFTK